MQILPCSCHTGPHTNFVTRRSHFNFLAFSPQHMCKSSVVLWAYLKPSASISASGKQTDSKAWEQHQEELHISFSSQTGLPPSQKLSECGRSLAGCTPLCSGGKSFLCICYSGCACGSPDNRCEGMRDTSFQMPLLPRPLGHQTLQHSW